MSDSGSKGDKHRVPLGWKTLVGLGAVALTIGASAVKAGGWVALSEVVTFAYGLAWLALFAHHLIHVYDGYFRDGLARPASLELILVIAWLVAGILLHQAPDPKLTTLAICWLLSTCLFFLVAIDMERVREKLIKASPTGYRPRRVTDVIRQSDAWLTVCALFERVEDTKISDLRERLSSPDTADGKLSHTTWLSCCSAAAIGMIAAAGAFGSTISPEEPAPPKPPDRRQEPEAKEKITIDSGAPINGDNGSGEAAHEGSGDQGEENCGGRYQPGPVPEPSRRALILAWGRVAGLAPDKMEALGYDIGGCPAPARRLPGLDASWYATGYCDGNLRAIAIALAGDDHPRVLLEQAAEFARPLILNGRFLSSEDRFEVGSGDAYIVHTRDGSFVLIRDDATGGPVGEGKRDGGGCSEYVDRDIAYTVAGPGLLDAWRAVAAVFPGGIYPIAYGTTSEGRRRIAMRSTVDGIVAVVQCSPSLLRCEGSIAGVERHWSGLATIGRAEVEALVLP